MSASDQRPWPGPTRAFELDIVGLGECSVDRIGVVPHWPAPGEKLDLVTWASEPGGQIATAMLACARLGMRAGYLGSVGDDSAAELALAPLRAAGIDTQGVGVVSGVATRTSLILVRESDGERAVLSARDPRLRLGEHQRRSADIERGGMLLVDTTDPDSALWAARCARRAGIPVVLDADRLWDDPDPLLSLIDFPVVTRGFAEEWGGTGSPMDGLQRLAERGAVLPVATCGSAGAIALYRGERLESPAIRAEVRDTTGAGDAFHAGFVFGLWRGWAVAEVLRAANAVAGLACGGAGAQAGLPDRGRLERCLRESNPVRGGSADAEGE